MTRKCKIIIIFSFLFFFNNELQVFAKSINDEININNRTREISQNIRCLVCQNQSIDESNSELAKDLKILIREKLIDGVSNEEIYGYLRERYGDYILLKPPLNLNTVILWFLPFIVLMFCSILIFKIIKSNLSIPHSIPIRRHKFITWYKKLEMFG